MSSPLKSSALLIPSRLSNIYTVKCTLQRCWRLKHFSLLRKKSPCRPRQSRVQVTPVEIVVRMLRVIRHQTNSDSVISIGVMSLIHGQILDTQCRSEIIKRNSKSWHSDGIISTLSRPTIGYMRQHQLRSDHHREFLFGCLPARDIRFVGANVVCAVQ